MDPRVGRFVSRDPWPGIQQQPRTRNGYTYVLNDPINRTDPSGLICIFGFGNCDKEPDLVAELFRAIPIPADFCLPGNLGCWGGEEYADWLENEWIPSFPDTVSWWRQHPAQAWGLPKGSLKTLMMENWFFELGDETMEFDQYHPATRILMVHSGVNAAREKFYRTGCVFASHYYDAARGREGLAKALIAVPAHLGVFIEIVFLIPDSVQTVEGTIGSYSIEVTNNHDGTAGFKVTNPTTRESGTFGLIRSRTREETDPNWLCPRGCGGDFEQVFVWDEPIESDLCGCR